MIWGVPMTGKLREEGGETASLDSVGSCISDIINNTVPELVLLQITTAMEAISKGAIPDESVPKYIALLGTYWLVKPASKSDMPSIRLIILAQEIVYFINIKYDQGKFFVLWVRVAGLIGDMAIPLGPKKESNDFLGGVRKLIGGLRSRFSW
ncbi:MAG: hypothetical protein WCX69_02135 [Candidatus Paceibacterota bacterium]